MYPGLHYTHKNLNFEKSLSEYKICFAVEKKRKKTFGANFKTNCESFLLSPSKNDNHTISIYENCMIGIFFDKSFSVFLYDAPNLMPK